MELRTGRQMVLGFTFFFIGCALFCAGAEADKAAAKPSYTLLQFLEKAPKPVFAEGHTLPPLARWGWSMPAEVSIELCEHWGYALEYAGYVTQGSVDAIDKKPNGRNARLLKLTASDPKKYPMFVLTHRSLQGRSLASLSKELRDGLYVHDKDGKPILDKGKEHSWRCVSPLAPDAIFEWAAEGMAAPLRKLREKAPIAMVFNGGEFGLSVAGHSKRFWEQDPQVLAAKEESGLDWCGYVSKRKTHQEMFIAEAVRQAVPDCRYYIWYHFGGDPTWDSRSWTYDYTYTHELTDIPSQSLYYKQFNSGWVGKKDMLSNFLCSVSQATERHGHALSYNWVCAGWGKRSFSEIDRYTGFLKSLYTAGMIGAVAGYFSLPEGRKGKPVGREAPHHLRQMMALGRVHALFSHLEDYLRQGSLLPGPLKHKNRNAAGLPAYELPTGDKTVRVLARKHKKENRWLVTAWAAAGDARDVSVEIPELDVVEINARPEGSVYELVVKRAVNYEPPEVEMRLVDGDGMHPSAGLAARK